MKNHPLNNKVPSAALWGSFEEDLFPSSGEFSMQQVFQRAQLTPGKQEFHMICAAERNTLLKAGFLVTIVIFRLWSVSRIIIGRWNETAALSYIRAAAGPRATALCPGRLCQLEMCSLVCWQVRGREDEDPEPSPSYQCDSLGHIVQQHLINQYFLHVLTSDFWVFRLKSVFQKMFFGLFQFFAIFQCNMIWNFLKTPLFSIWNHLRSCDFPDFFFLFFAIFKITINVWFGARPSSGAQGCGDLLDLVLRELQSWGLQVAAPLLLLIRSNVPGAQAANSISPRCQHIAFFLPDFLSKFTHSSFLCSTQHRVCLLQPLWAAAAASGSSVRKTHR